MDALENAGRQPASVYKDCTLYTTLSPCPMCTGAILLYGIKRVVIGENKSYQGSEKLLRENGVEVSVVNNSECIEMMADFINNHSGLWNEDIGVL
jgi:cytosine deaminase